MKAYVAIFFLAGSPSAVVGPPLYGGSTKVACDIYAAQIIRDIKLGSELMGSPYRPINSRCEMVKRP